MFKVKKLHISGFKSFAFPTEFEIGDGITGIIGPNGCGKSNVFEAIRLVMGESSSKSLRSNFMDEVIFNGTEKIPAKNFAEVSIELEGEEKSKTLIIQQILAFSAKRHFQKMCGCCFKPNKENRRCAKTH